MNSGRLAVFYNNTMKNGQLKTIFIVIRDCMHIIFYVKLDRLLKLKYK